MYDVHATQYGNHAQILTYFYSNSRFQTIEINAVAKFPLHFLNEKHPYRYVVKHPDYNPWFESFYDFASGGTRCLEFDDQASSDIRPS